MSWLASGGKLPFGPKPSNPVIAWGKNSLTQGLVFDANYVAPNVTNGSIELVSGERGVFDSGFPGTPGIGPHGAFYGFTATAASDTYNTAPNKSLAKTTIEFLINVTVNSGGPMGGIIVAKGSTTSGGGGAAYFNIGYDASGPGNLYFDVGRSTTDGEWETVAAAFAMNSWNHVVLTYDGTTGLSAVTVTVNGKLVAIQQNATPAGTTVADSTQTAVGNWPFTGLDYAGLISHLRMWNRVLAPQEIRALYQNPWQIYRAPFPSVATNAGASTISSAMTALGVASMAAVGAERAAGAMAALGAAVMTGIGKTQLRTAMTALGAASMSVKPAAINPSVMTATGAASMSVGTVTLCKTAMVALGAATMAAAGAERDAAKMTATGAASMSVGTVTLCKTAMTSLGVATMASVGHARISAAVTALGAASAVFATPGTTTITTQMNAVGVANMSVGTVTLRKTAMTALGAANMSVGTVTLCKTAMTALGAATMAAGASAVLPSVMTVTGAASMSAVGRTIATGAMAALGAASMLAVGHSVATGAMQAVGAANMQAMAFSGVSSARMRATGAAFFYGSTIVPIANPCDTLEGDFRCRCERGRVRIRELEGEGCGCG